MIARLITTARAMSSICASRTPDSSNSRRGSARICCSRARRLAAAADCRLGARVGAAPSSSRAVLMSPMLVQLRFTTRVSGERAHRLDRVRLLGGLVVAVAEDPGEAQGEAAGVPGRALQAVERDLDDLRGPHVHDVALAVGLQLEEALGLPGEHLVGHPLE